MENRKVKLSKYLLKRAFVELLEEKSFKHISVRSLCERADLNRSTFYAHYEDINYLIDDIENDIIQEIPFIPYKNNDSHLNITEFTKFVKQNHSTIVLLIKNGKLIDKLVEKSVEFYLKTEGPKTDEEIEIFTNMSHYCIGGMFHAYIYWASSKNPLSIEEITEILYSLFVEAAKIRFNYKK